MGCHSFLLESHETLLINSSYHVDNDETARKKRLTKSLDYFWTRAYTNSQPFLYSAQTVESSVVPRNWSYSNSSFLSNSAQTVEYYLIVVDDYWTGSFSSFSKFPNRFTCEFVTTVVSLHLISIPSPGVADTSKTLFRTMYRNAWQNTVRILLLKYLHNFLPMGSISP